MTIYYVDSTKTGGTNTGGSWTNAYLSIVSAAAVAVSGDEIWLEDGHSETLAANLIIGTNANDLRGVMVKSMSEATGLFSAGATIIPAALTFTFIGVIAGIHFDNSGSANGVKFSGSSGAHYILCTFSKQSTQSFLIGNNTATPGLSFTDCTFASGSAFDRCIAFNYAGSIVRFIRPIFTGTKTTTAYLFGFTAGNANGLCELIGADLSAFDNLASLPTSASSGTTEFVLRRCLLAASVGYDVGQTYLRRQGAKMLLIGCASGTLSAPAYSVDYQQFEGYCKTVGTHYRTDGATDETTPYSLALLAAANHTWKQSRRAAQTIEISGWVASGAERTVTVYLAHNAVGAGAAGALTNAECWAELEAPWVGASPTAQGYDASSMCTLAGTPAALTTDGTSSWTGANIGTHQKIDFTFTPAISGQVVARVFLAPESASDVGPVYIDSVLGIA